LQLVDSYAGIHEMLYKSDEVNSYDNIVVSKLLRELSGKVVKANFMREVVILPDIKDDLNLPSKKVVPIALALYELLTNSLEHAFGNVSNPSITYSISDIGNGDYEFEYTDNGIGLPKEFYNGKEGHMGMKIINSQFRKDLNCMFSIGANDTGGLRYVVNF